MMISMAMMLDDNVHCPLLLDDDDDEDDDDAHAAHDHDVDDEVGDGAGDDYDVVQQLFDVADYYDYDDDLLSASMILRMALMLGDDDH